MLKPSNILINSIYSISIAGFTKEKNWLEHCDSTDLRFLKYLKQTLEAVAWRCSVKKVFLEIWQNSQETPVPESLF